MQKELIDLALSHTANYGFYQDDHCHVSDFFMTFFQLFYDFFRLSKLIQGS